ncbi:MAG: hypothetical protein WD048_13035, partial [Chitinophagales bacterium]
MRCLIVFFSLLLFLFFNLSAQVPDSINYQAVIRNSSGNIIVNRPIDIRFRILSGSVSGTVVYEEEHATSTNKFGLVNIVIGGGTPILGVFSDVDWASNQHWLEVGIDIERSNNYTTIGSSQFISVPYALHSKTAEFASNDFDTDPTNEFQIFKVVGDTVTLSNGNSFIINNIPRIDDQNLFLQNDSLFIEDGNGVDLSGYLNTDEQTISISNDTIFLSNGGFAILPSTTVNTDDQNLSISNDSLLIEDGVGVDISPYLDNTDAQVLAISNDTVFLSNGGFIKLPAGFSGNYNDLTNAPTNVSSFVNDANYVSIGDISDNDSTNELQNLQGFINGTVLTIAINDGDSAIVNLAGLVDGLDTDSTNELQNISISGDTIFLSDGGSIILPSGTIDTDDQTLSLNNDTLSIQDGNSIYLGNIKGVDGDSTNELQTIFISGDTLFLSDGGFVVLDSVGTDDQVISISNDTVYLEDGGFVKLPEGFSGDYNDLTN